ncbi:hypothetical protein BJ878DRAFT_498145 [Calycina marina]|uniref:Uncharacterized protein n=1 Tax=Calycina marina TaxID=1763456 RepID=A0A9P7Z6H8_9HELO|nr:hypothetical protein BJ878DRAFT_498145 [Calycina marina]
MTSGASRTLFLTTSAICIVLHATVAMFSRHQHRSAALSQSNMNIDVSQLPIDISKAWRLSKCENVCLQRDVDSRCESKFIQPSRRKSYEVCTHTSQVIAYLCQTMYTEYVAKHADSLSQ